MRLCIGCENSCHLPTPRVGGAKWAILLGLTEQDHNGVTLTDNNVSSCELALWDIASWIVKDEKRCDELSRIFEEPGLTALERRAMCEKFAGEIFSNNVNDDELQRLLNCLGTHPSSRLSAVRSALVYVDKGYTAYSSTDTFGWFERYREAVLEQKAIHVGTTDMIFKQPAAFAVREEVMA